MPYREGLQALDSNNDVLTMEEQAEVEGEVDVYVEHLNVNDLRKELILNVEPESINRPGVVIEETVTQADDKSDGNSKAKDIPVNSGRGKQLDCYVIKRVIGQITEANDGNKCVRAEFAIENNVEPAECLSRPSGSGERVRTGGVGDTLRFEMQDSESEYDSSDELYTESDSEGEGGIRYPQFNHDKDIGDLTFKIGMVFSNKEEFKSACKAYGIKHSVERYLRVYNHVINPIDGHDMWPKAAHDNKILPLEAKQKNRGRKQKARRKEAEELEQAAIKGKLGRKGKVSVSCSICGQVGHNKRYHGQKGTTANEATYGITSRSNQEVKILF
ncbi:hypothetical protein GH714_010954 [Hevea brasiliensis]|uniref:Transposase MuDR plant domain-containing protein n=1 Tax=Hevea brasiliensis TaxID=3981 RepID=A0A6A6LFM8_HEVBR|nr:hypothetical protein GH714_010954 [Hevea brasiliensis]